MSALQESKKDYITFTHWDSGAKGQMQWITDQMPLSFHSASELQAIFTKYDFFEEENMKKPEIVSSFLSDFFKREVVLTKILEFRFQVAGKSEWGFEFNFR